MALNSYYTDAAKFTGTPSEYVGFGYAKVYQSCSAYFDVLIRSQNLAGYSGDIARSAGATGIALNTLRADAELAQREIVRWTAVTGLVTTIIDAFDDRALMTPYPTETKTLILRALTAYEERNPPGAADSRAEALSFVAGYAEMCTYSGATRFAKQALSNAEPRPGGPTAISPAEQALLKALAITLGDASAPLSLRQVAILEYHFNMQPTWDAGSKQRKALLAELPAGVKAQLVDNKGEPIEITKVPSAKAVKEILKSIVSDNDTVRRELDAVTVAMTTQTKDEEVASIDKNGKAQKELRPRLVFPTGIGAASTARQEIRF